MTLVVNINDWLVDEDLPDGPSRLRRSALRILRFIEYGAPVPHLHGRETLIHRKSMLPECLQRFLHVRHG